MILIGLGHRARTGKDTVGQFLTAEHRFLRHGFADALKRFAVAANPIISSRVEGDIRLSHAVANCGWERTKETFRESRVFLQHLGIAARDMFGADVWVNIVMEEIAQRPTRDHVICDVRFPNEAAAIRAAGGLVFRVDRPGVLAANAHVSEHALDDFEWDGVIANDGTLDDLGFMVKELVAELRGGRRASA